MEHAAYPSASTHPHRQYYSSTMTFSTARMKEREILVGGRSRRIDVDVDGYRIFGRERRLGWGISSHSHCLIYSVLEALNLKPRFPTLKSPATTKKRCCTCTDGLSSPVDILRASSLN